MTALGDLAVRMSVLLAATLAALQLLRGRSAALRHWMLASAILSSAALPLLAPVAPVWRSPLSASPAVLAPGAELRDGVTYTVLSRAPTPGGPAHARGSAAADERASTRAITTIWAVGAAACAAMLAIAFLRLRRLARLARPLDVARWNDAAAEIARRAGVTRGVRLLLSDHPTLLATWGFRHPTIILPSTARDWSDERMGIVLRHEIAHVQRGDWLMQVAAELVRAANWFNPIVWVACRRLRIESERACDDAVLGGGVPPADYASHLVDLARAFSAHRRPYLPAPAMARASGLEGRIAAMLNAGVNRSPVTRRAQVITAAAFLAAALSVAGLRAQRFSTVSGMLVDQTNAVLPNVAVSLSNPATLTRHEVRTDRTGHFELAGLTDGDYQLAINEPGFQPVRETVTIAGRDLSRSWQLTVGDLHETISVTAGAAATPPNLETREKARAYAAARNAKVAERCGGATPLPGGNIGGNIMAPSKIADRKPVYPEGAQPGVVTLEALIGTDGTVREVHLVSGDSNLGQAAADAIRQWEFSPTYLNCTPVEVHMGVTANFVAK